MGQKNFSCAHIFGLNSLLDSHKDDSSGFFRRCLFIPFSRDFSKNPTAKRWDPMQLSMEIAKERGPIMAMALDAAIFVLKRGHYTETLSSTRLLRGYRETNPFFEFCSGLDKAATSNNKKDWMTLGTLWAEFNRLQYNSGYTGSDAIKKGKFLEKMKDTYPAHHAYYGRRWVFCLNFVLEEDVPRIGIVSAQRAGEFEKN
jgi:phage/plasmid-associated DNA primase